jgi:hypothetical protein
MVCCSILCHVINTLSRVTAPLGASIFVIMEASCLEGLYRTPYPVAVCYEIYDTCFSPMRQSRLKQDSIY